MGVDVMMVSSFIGLILIISVHIVVIARWSGKIDGYILAMTKNIERIDLEILQLRNAKHEMLGQLQRHSAAIRQLELDRQPWERRNQTGDVTT